MKFYIILRTKFTTRIPDKILFSWSKAGKWLVQDIPAISGSRETHTGVWWENLKKRVQLESLVVGGI